VNTTVLKIEYPCEPLKTNTTFAKKVFEALGYILDPDNPTPLVSVINGTSQMATTILLTKDGCRYQIDASVTVQINAVDSVVWTRWSDQLFGTCIHNLSAFRNGLDWNAMQDTSNNPSAWFYVPGNRTYYMHLHTGPTSPFLRFNTTAKCHDKDIILFATKMLGSDWSLMSNYTQHAWVCSPRISVADIPITISTSDMRYNITLDENDFSRRQAPISPDIINISRARTLFHTSQWASYAPAPLFGLMRQLSL